MNTRYKILHTCWKVLSLLPLSAHYVLSDLFIYPFVYYIIRYRRTLVRRQLAESFPEKEKKELRDIERRFYHFFCDYLVETVKMATISEQEIRRRVEWIGMEQLQQRMLQHDHYYAFAYLGHIGNWEWMASFALLLKENFVGAQIYHPLRNQNMNQLFLHVRKRFGGSCIPMKETLRRILSLRKEKKRPVVGFIADQSPKWEAMHQWCRFLNHDTSFFIGTERLGKQLGAEIWYVQVTRPRRGYYRAELKFMADAEANIPDFELTNRYAQLLEQNIFSDPHLWLWTHNRWKRTRQEWERLKGIDSTKE